jgi:hypothetical protein
MTADLPSILTLSFFVLMADAGPRRHDAEIVEGFLRPFQELVALLVLPVFLVHVLLEGRVAAEEVDGDGVVADEIDRHQRIDLARVAAELLHGVPHRCEIDHCGHPGEILHQYPSRAKRDLPVRGLGLEPLRDRLEVLLGDRAAILVAQEILEQDLEGEGKAGNALEPVLLRGREAVIGVGLAADLERFAAPETVERSHPLFFRCLAGGIMLPGRRPNGELRSGQKRVRSNDL